MSRRQSLDRPGILSPPGPFLTPSPSPSISASPRLQPSPSLSPFPQDVLLVTGNPLTNNSTHEQERKTVTPGRRQSIHQFTNGSPSAGTVVFQPSPSQSPAAATSVIGVTAGGGLNVVAGFPNSISQNTITTSLPTITTTTGNELNTTLVGSNNIQLNKKGTKRQQQQQHQQQQQQQQHHQIFSSSSHYSHLPSLSTTTTIAGGYGQLHATTINNTPNTFATTTVASTPKNQTKKGAANSATVLPISQQSTNQQQQQQQQSQQQFQQYQTSSPLIADSPSPSPSGTAITSASIKPPTPQPAMQMLQQQFTIASNGNGGNGGPQQQTFQLIQGPQGQIIAAATSQNLQQQQLNRFNPTPTTNIVTSTGAAALGPKSVKAPQQILPKPQQLQQQQLLQQQQQQLVDQITLAQQQKSKTPNPTPPPAPVTSSSNMSQPSLTQISQTAQPGQQQIILPSGATASLTTTAQQPLLLNQVPVLVQQNTPQGVQLILRPPTPQLTATPSLVIQNRAQPQLQQHQQPQQVLRILGTNGATMQLAAATPTFIVSSQANLIQQANHLQTIKTQSQSPAITQLSGLHAALSAAAAANSQQQRSQQFATTAATINGHLLSPSVAAQLQNLQLAAAAANGNGLTAQIQMPNGLTTSGATTLLSQLPGTAQFQQNSQGFNINLNQLSGANIQQIAAAAAAGATFQTPPPPQTQNAANNGQPQNQQNSGNNNTTANTTTATNDLFSNSSNSMSNLTQSSPAHCPVAVTPEPLRQPTPVLQNIPAASPQLQQTHNPPTQIQLSLNAAATIQLQQHQQQQQQAQIQQLQQQIQQTQNQVQQAQQQANQIQQQQTHQIQQQVQNLPPQQVAQTVQQETKKKPKPRKKKPPAANSSSNASTANNKSLTTTANKSLNTNTSTTSVLAAPTITSTSNTIKMVPNITGQEQIAGHQQITTNITTNAPPTNQINQSFHDTTTMPVLKSPSPPPPQIQRASNGKLDLGNVMKLCGITDEDDEDFMDTTPTEEPTTNQAINPSQNFTISIPQPNGTSETLPYTLSIPGIQSTPTANENTESSQEPAANIVIKIDPTETGVGSTNSSMAAQPYSITIPRLPTQEEIQKQSQQHLNNQQQNDNNALQLKQQQNLLAAQPLNTNITFSMPMNSVASSMAPSNIPQLISNSLAPSNSIANCVVPVVSTSVVTTTTTTTATVKPRRKPAAKRNNKKDANNAANSTNSSVAANSINLTQTVSATSSVITPAANITTSAISTPLSTPALVPSQIGNIQISQIENRLGNNQNQMISAPMTSLVENKIQIMPIMDNKNTNSAQMPQLQQTQIVFQPNNTTNNITIAAAPSNQSHQTLQQDQNRPMQLVALPQLSNSSQTSNVSTSTLNQQQPPSLPTAQISVPLQNPPTSVSNPTLMPPVPQNTMLPGLTGNVSISVGTPNTIAGIIPQLTGSLTLAVSEQCERLILRHDPNQKQDQQSQLILQALLKGALPNVTIINEPTKVEPPKSTPTTTAVTAIQQPTLPQLMLTPTSVPSTPTTSAPSSINNSTGAISKANKKTNKQNTEAAKQTITQNVNPNQIPKPADGNSNSSSIGNLNSNLNTNMDLGVNPQIPPNVTMSQQRYIALPKIDPSTHQLFSLNPLNNQITSLNPNQTTASIGPSERLLIAPAGINAQQLAQCLQQGQLHFNDVNPITPQQTPAMQQQQQMQQTNNLQMTQQQPINSMTCNSNTNQQPKQQIVYPMTSQMNVQGMITTTTTTTTTTSNTTTVCSSTQPATTTTTTTTTKQVANVAPIIDQSKAKQDVKQINNTASGVSTGAVPKKKPVRKPKASTTTAADVALMKNASVVKPMPKLDPLSQKPNNNPVQIVQPNTASGKPVVSTSNTSTTTTTSNVVTIQPFQTQTSTGTKLVGVTAPMQQQPQNNLQQTQQQRPQINYTPNFSTGITTTTNATNLNTNPPINNLNNNGVPLTNNTNNTMTTGINNPPANQPQQTVSRPIQTIQLNSQLQQMLKQVQMQIQYLTVKLQHKNLLSSMPLPADLDPNIVAAFNKPMSDMEINTALQRLFMEQQRIIDAGKEVPTPEPFIRNAANATGNFVLMQTNNFTPDNSKLNAGSIPANVVQPNNHSTLSGNINAANITNTTMSNIQQQPTQKIHIYPIQHQQQSQQQNKQSKQTKQQQQVALNNTNSLNVNNTNSSNVTLTTPTSVATIAGNSGSKVTTKQKTIQNQQQPQLSLQQTQNNNNNSNTLTTTTMVNPPTLKPQLPQLSSLTTTPSLPSLPYPSLPHVINIANMPAVLQQKHFTQHLQMQQQQLIQQQQQQQQKLQNSNTKPSNNFTTFNVNLANLPGFQQGPPPLIFPTSTTTSTNNNNATVAIAATTTSAALTTTIPQLSALSQQHQPIAQLQQPTQIQFQASNIATAPTFAVSIGNQKAYVPIITGAIATVTSSAIQQTSIASSVASMNTLVSALPQLITATAATSTHTTTAAAPSIATASSVLVPTSAPTITAATGSLKPMLTLTPTSTSANHTTLNNSIVVQNAIFNGGVNVNIVGNPIAQNQNQTVVKTEEQISPKAKLARLSLFLRQLEVDQQSCLNPDYKSPFQNKEEAVKRLIRYHCMYQTDEDIPSEEEEEFEKTALRFQDKFRELSSKFQQILLQESMLEHRTSEIVQIKQLMVDDLRQEIEDSKQLEKDILEYELLQQQQQLQPELQPQQQDEKYDIKKIENSNENSTSNNPSPLSTAAGLFDQIKNEVKSEPLDVKPNLEVNSNNDSNSNFCNNLQSSSASLDSIKNEIKGEPCENSLTSSSGVKSSCSSMDSFDLLKQSPIVNNSFKKQTNNEAKEPKKEELANQWKQSYMDSKGTNNYYSHLANASVNMSKPSNNVFNGAVKKPQAQQPSTASAATPTATASVVNVEIKKDEKDSFENFDIESEITPSFIMKKQEPKEPISTTSTTASVTTTATSATVQSTSTTNAHSSTTKHQNAKSAKQAKLSHTFENNTHATSNTNAVITNSFSQTQSTSSNTTSQEVITNFDFSQHLPVNTVTTKQQEDDWLCIQKELNLMNTVNPTVSSKNIENTTNNSTPQTATEPLGKTLDFLSNTTTSELFPNGCINKTMEPQLQNQTPTNVANNSCNTTTAMLANSSCSQQNQQPSLSLAGHEDNQQATDLNEFFSGSEDSEVHKDVETRLEAMFGESPVHLTGNKERSDSPDDIESGLESIFGESNKSPSNNHCAAKEKSNWEADFTANAFMSSNQQHSTNYMNTTNSMPHHIQLGSANNPRWMQNMEAQFPDFLTAGSGNNNAAVNDCLASRKRQWNGHIVDDNSEHVQQQTQQQLNNMPQDEESPQKKMCDGSLNTGGLNDSSTSNSSPLGMQSQQQQQPQTHHQHHNLVPNDTTHAQELMDAALLSLHDGLGVDSSATENPNQTNGFTHMMNHQNFNSYNMDNNQQQQQQQQHFMNIVQQQNMTVQQQQMLNNHMMQMNHHQQQQNNMHGNHHAGTGEFDDDITRHVQNAIDSILNLQSSEADSLSFSLDHSMGSFLGDTILNDNQSGGTNNAASCQDPTKRRQLVDELSDCLMGNSSTETPLLMDTTGSTTTHSQLMNHSTLHHNNMQQQHINTTGNTGNNSTMNHHHASATGGSNISQQQQQQLNDFNCVVGGIDDAVKSIMSS